MNASSHDTQEIRALIQPWGGGLEYEREGVMSKTTHFLFCNPVTAPNGGAAVDIIFGDTIMDAAGKEYRVELAEDAAGQGDHFEVQLRLLEPGNGD